MLNGKTALITGGTSGIGLVTAKLLSNNGAHVAVVGRSEDSFKLIRDTIGGHVLTIKADVLSATTSTRWQRMSRIPSAPSISSSPTPA